MERESSWQQQSRVKSVPKDYPIEIEPLPEQSTKKDGRKLEDDEESDWEDMQEEPPTDPLSTDLVQDVDLLDPGSQMVRTVFLVQFLQNMNNSISLGCWSRNQSIPRLKPWRRGQVIREMRLMLLNYQPRGCCPDGSCDWGLRPVEASLWKTPEGIH